MRKALEGKESSAEYYGTVEAKTGYARLAAIEKDNAGRPYRVVRNAA
jgi:hypothetical protein